MSNKEFLIRILRTLFLIVVVTPLWVIQTFGLFLIFGWFIMMGVACQLLKLIYIPISDIKNKKEAINECIETIYFLMFDYFVFCFLEAVEFIKTGKLNI